MTRRHILPLLLCLLAAVAVQAAIVVGRAPDLSLTASNADDQLAASKDYVCTACGPIRSISPQPRPKLAVDVDAILRDSRK